jgi:hypothetical protein
LAAGVWVEEPSITGRVVYQKPPDYKAIAYLIDRIMGKPTDRKEHNFPDRPLEELTDDELKAIRDS